MPLIILAYLSSFDVQYSCLKYVHIAIILVFLSYFGSLVSCLGRWLLACSPNLQLTKRNMLQYFINLMVLCGRMASPFPNRQIERAFVVDVIGVMLKRQRPYLMSCSTLWVGKPATEIRFHE
jgi:hypothetical protein